MATAQTASEKIAALKLEIEHLEAAAIAEKRAEIKEARKVLSQLEKELEELTGKPAGEDVSGGTRKRLAAIVKDDAEYKDILGKAQKYLAGQKEGAPSKAILLAAGVPNETKLINRARIVLEDKAFKTTGQKNKTRYFLK